MSKIKSMQLTDARLKFGKLGLLAKPAPIEVIHDGKVQFLIVSPEWFAQHQGSTAEPTSPASSAAAKRVVRPLAKNPMSGNRGS